jgi:transcriptional regulator with XRE-family HTH domain
MDALSLPEALKLIMKTQGWSQNRLARELGISQSWLSYAARGMKDTSTTKAIQILARVGWELRITPKVEGDDPVNRREFVTAAASVAFIPARKGDPFQDHQYIRLLAARSSRMGEQIGGVPLVATALRHAHNIRFTINSGDRQLQIAAAELAHQAAMVMYDARKFHKAEQIGQFSLALAKRSGDLNSQARAYQTLSQISTYQGKGEHGAEYALHGLRIPDISPSERALLTVRLGRSLALTPGQERKARAALDAAQGIDGIPSSHTPWVTGNVGVALGSLRAFREADRYLGKTVQSSLSPLNQALYLGHQVTTSLSAGEPVAAADQMDALANVVPLVTSSHVDQHVREILTASAHRTDVREVRASRERLRTVAFPHLVGQN